MPLVPGPWCPGGPVLSEGDDEGEAGSGGEGPEEPLSGASLAGCVCLSVPVIECLLTINVLYPGDCLEGWTDATDVAMGCLFAYISYSNVDEVTKKTYLKKVFLNNFFKFQPTAETACNALGETSRLVEVARKLSKLECFLSTQVFNHDQMNFLKNYLATVEEELELGSNLYWWIGRTILILCYIWNLTSNVTHNGFFPCYSC